MKKICIILCLMMLLLSSCNTTEVTGSALDNTSFVPDVSRYKEILDEQMQNKTVIDLSHPKIEVFLYHFPRQYAYFDLVSIYRFNYYGNSRRAILWEHSEAIFNCSIIDDEELIKRLKEEGYKEVKTFNNEVKFAWREFEDDFVEPICFEQKYVAEDITYGSKTYYNKVVICKPFNNPDAKANEKVVFFDICCDNNRMPHYEEVIKTIDGRPVTEILNSSKEWKLIEPY